MKEMNQRLKLEPELSVESKSRRITCMHSRPYEYWAGPEYCILQFARLLSGMKCETAYSIWHNTIFMAHRYFAELRNKWFKRLFSVAIAFIILYMINNITFMTAQQHQWKADNILWLADIINLIDAL